MGSTCTVAFLLLEEVRYTTDSSSELQQSRCSLINDNDTHSGGRHQVAHYPITIPAVRVASMEWGTVRKEVEIEVGSLG